MPLFSSDIIPDTTGRKLGTPDQQYDAYIRNLVVSGTVTGNFTGLKVNSLSMLDVAYSDSPVFDAQRNSSFRIVLTGNVTTPAVINQNRSQLYAFIIIQNAIGGFTFVWPANVRGGMAIGTGPGEMSTQLFISDGTSLVALGPGVIE